MRFGPPDSGFAPERKYVGRHGKWWMRPGEALARSGDLLGAEWRTVACLGAMEAIKVLGELGEPLAGTLLTCDLRDMTFRRRRLLKREDCPVCGTSTEALSK